MSGLFLIAITACQPNDKTQTESDWQLIESEIGPGMLLSGWSDQEDVLMVGGGMYGQGDGVLVRYSPRDNHYCWKTLVSDHALWWIHGDGEGEWWAVGDNGVVVHHENGVTSREDIDTEMTLYGVYVDNDIVWAVGGDVDERIGAIFKRENNIWQPYAENLPGVVFKVFDGFFVGDQIAYEHDPQTDELIDLENNERLITVRGTSADNMWAVGGQASAIAKRWDGNAWIQSDTTGLNLPLNGVWTAPNETVWVAGMSGTQGYLNEEGSWSVPDFQLTSDHFHAVWRHGDETLFIGGNFLSTSPPYWGTIVRHGPAKDQPTIGACAE